MSEELNKLNENIEKLNSNIEKLIGILMSNSNSIMPFESKGVSNSEVSVVEDVASQVRAKIEEARRQADMQMAQIKARAGKAGF